MVNNLLEIGNAPAESEDEDPVWEPTKALTFETMGTQEKKVPALEPEEESKIDVGTSNKASAMDAETTQASAIPAETFKDPASTGETIKAQDLTTVTGEAERLKQA